MKPPADSRVRAHGIQCQEHRQCRVTYLEMLSKLSNLDPFDQQPSNPEAESANR